MALELATTIDATEDERLAQAEALVRSFCGWHIAPSRTETVVVRGTGASTLLLPSMHVTAIASVTVDSGALTVDDEFTWSQIGVLTHAGHWGADEVSVAMTHGWDTAPPEVTAVVQAIARRAVDNPSALTRQTRGPFTEQYSTAGTGALLDSEKDALRRYRIPGVG